MRVNFQMELSFALKNTWGKMKFRHELIFLLLKETERKHNIRIIDYWPFPLLKEVDENEIEKNIDLFFCLKRTLEMNLFLILLLALALSKKPIIFQRASRGLQKGLE